MSTLFLLLLLLGAAGNATAERIYSGLKNAVFYAKGQAYQVPRLQPYIDDLHTIEAPLWYVNFFQHFMLLVAVGWLRGLPWYGIIGAAWLVAQGASTTASYWYQGFINLGCMRPWVDPEEPRKAEFALAWPFKVSFWWRRPWWGPRRKVLPFVGLAMIVAGVAWLVWGVA